MSAPTRVPPPGLDPLRDLQGRLDLWVGEHLISREEAEAISVFEARTREGGRTPGRAAPLTEALSYLGAALAIAALGIVLGRSWNDVATGVRIAIPGAICLIFLVAGWLLGGDRGSGRGRLSRVLWFFSAAALVWCVVLIVVDGFGVEDRWPFLWSGAAVSVYAGVLYLARPGSLQQLALIGGLALLAGGALFGSPSGIGIAIWAIGIAWILLGWRGRLIGWDTALLLGTLAALIGSMAVQAELEGVGRWLALATAAGLIGAGVALRSTPMLVLAAIGLFQSTLSTVQFYMGEGLGTAIGLLVAGAAILLLAFLIARLRPRGWRAPRTGLRG